MVHWPEAPQGSVTLWVALDLKIKSNWKNKAVLALGAETS